LKKNNGPPKTAQLAEITTLEIILLAEDPSYYGAQRLITEATQSGIKISHLNPFDHQFFLDNTLNSKAQKELVVLNRITGIRYDEFDLSLSMWLAQQGAKIFNPINAIVATRDKMHQFLLLSQNKIPIIPTFSFRGKVDASLIDEIQNLFITSIPELDKQNLKYILKANRGNKGIGVNLLESKKSLESILQTFWGMRDQKFMIQPYLEGGEEHRIFLTQKEILGAITKQNRANDFRNNGHFIDGIKDNIAALPADLISTAQAAIKASGAFYAGIDILRWKNRNYVLEVNLVPGFELLEKVTNINIAKKLINSIVENTKAQ